MRLSADRLEVIAGRLRAFLAPCRLCPNECGVDRLSGEVGRCGVDSRPRVAAFGTHFGEEPPLVGASGSGAVFFSGCSLRCVYCQNWSISRLREGRYLSTSDLAGIFLRLQAEGCANLNLVTPTHQAHAIASALAIAVTDGLRLPIVWNCGGYESAAVLRWLEGVVDIYMPDLKYGDSGIGERLSGVCAYVDRSREAVLEMHRQVGDLRIDRDGLARSGLLVRHLVLPGGLAGTETVVRFLADEISEETYVNLMDQYRPCHEANQIEELAGRTTKEEYASAVRMARGAGLRRFA